MNHIHTWTDYPNPKYGYDQICRGCMAQRTTAKASIKTELNEKFGKP